MDPSAATVETWERRPGAACAPLGGSRRREPERTLLHAVVRERLEPFLAAARDRSPSGRGLPAHLERDLRAYLDCGILGRGFARVRYPDCGFERLVALSCKARSCPSCNARRMDDAADHLVHDVFPRVPVRQWVLSFPRRLRFLAVRDPGVASRLLDLFTRAVFAWQRRRARRLHTLIPDGVFDLSGDGPARFVPLKAPSDDEVAGVLTAIIEGLEKLCRSAVRPPFALHRLSQGPDGRLVYRMKRPRGGSLLLVLTPDQLLSRIATLVPPPRTHALRCHGLFAPKQGSPASRTVL